MQSNKKISVYDLYKSHGLLFPTNSDEVLAFEQSNDINIENPKDWENPINIIKRGKVNNIKINNLKIHDESITNLAMAARDGKAISDEVRKRMNDDRDKSKKE